MASLKDVRGKITGVGKTKQITRAMNMVASAKLRGAQSRMEKFSAYAERFHAMLEKLSSAGVEMAHTLLTPRAEVKKAGIILVTSDRGLCGGFNVNIISRALQVARAKKAEGAAVVFFCAGRKGREAVRKAGYALARDYPGVMGDLSFSVASRVGFEVLNAFADHELDEVILVYGKFFNLARQVPAVEPLLPIAPRAAAENAAQNTTEYLFEPSGGALLDALLPKIVNALIYRGLLETSTSEYAARMTAMDNATRNCDDLIKSLTRLFNKTRQAVITSELIDIVGGVEALKG